MVQKDLLWKSPVRHLQVTLPDMEYQLLLPSENLNSFIVPCYKLHISSIL